MRGISSEFAKADESVSKAVQSKDVTNSKVDLKARKTKTSIKKDKPKAQTKRGRKADEEKKSSLK